MFEKLVNLTNGKHISVNDNIYITDVKLANLGPDWESKLKRHRLVVHTQTGKIMGWINPEGKLEIVSDFSDPEFNEFLKKTLANFQELEKKKNGVTIDRIKRKLMNV